MGTAFELVRRFGDRLRQIHLSEVNSQSKHEPLSAAAVHATCGLARILPSVAVMLESVVEREEIDVELKMARAALGPREYSRAAQSEAAEPFVRNATGQITLPQVFG